LFFGNELSVGYWVTWENGEIIFVNMKVCWEHGRQGERCRPWREML